MHYQEYGEPLANLGYDVTPLEGKKPFLQGWQKRPEAAKDFSRHGGANVGVLTGGAHNIIAVDIDVRDESAAKRLRDLAIERLGNAPERIGCAPKTLLTYRCTEQVKKVKGGIFEINGVDANVEVLADGQQFVAAGIHPDTQQPYTWPDDDLSDYRPNLLSPVTPEQIQGFIIEADVVLSKYGKLKSKPRDNGNGANSLVTQKSDPLGLFTLREHSKQATPKEVESALAVIPSDIHYDDWCNMAYAIKGALGDSGFNIFDTWSRKAASYEVDAAAKLWHSIESVDHIGAGTIFARAKEYGFSISQWRKYNGPKTAETGNTSPLVINIQSGPEFVGGFVAPEFIIDDIIQRGYFYSLTGKTGHGKTCIAVYLTFCIAHGIPFAGHDVEKGNVCYLVGENPDDVRARFLVAAEAYGLPIVEAMDFIPQVFDIEEKFPFIESRAKEVGGYTAVIVDTSAAYFQGDEENSNTQLGHYARQALRPLTTLQGKPTVIVPCHPIKNPSRDTLLPRGGGAYIAEVDGNLTLWSDDDGSTTQLHIGKVRGPGFEPIDLELVVKTSDKVKDNKGRHIPSVVAQPISEEKATELTKEARSNENALLDMMINLPNGSYADWCEKLGWIGKTGSPQKAKVFRTMDRLKADKLVHRYRGKYKLTPKGKTEAQNVL
jgi:hypothetical protein